MIKVTDREQDLTEALREAYQLIAAAWFDNRQDDEWNAAAERWRDEHFRPFIHPEVET